MATVVKTLKESKRMTKKELEEFDALKDEDIDYSDIPPTDEEFWKDARVIKPARKKAISLKLDPDLLEWYKAHGKGYQTLMRNVLQAYMNAQEKANV
jgi:uncharacterized protein (DUF4415 family)